MIKQVLVDPNVILDLFTKRPYFYREAQNLFTLGDYGRVELTISALSIANTHYLLSKKYGDRKARTYVKKLQLMTTVASLTSSIIQRSQESDFRDFEDAIQYYSALEFECDVLVTRNLKDFKKSKIPVMTAGAFIDSLEIGG